MRGAAARLPVECVMSDREAIPILTLNMFCGCCSIQVPRSSRGRRAGDVLGRFVLVCVDRRIRIDSDENGPIALAASEEQ